MYGCPEEIWAELAELPGGARRIWRRAFWRAWPRAGGDCRRAAAMAWQAFALEAKGCRATSREINKGGQADLEAGSTREKCGATARVAEAGRGVKGRLGQVLGAITAKVAAGWLVVRKVLEAAGSWQSRGPWAGGFGQENLDTVFAEAVAKGWLKPEQRPWAEALARRDGQALREFFELAAAAADYQAGRDGGGRHGMK